MDYLLQSVGSMALFFGGGWFVCKWFDHRQECKKRYEYLAQIRAEIARATHPEHVAALKAELSTEFDRPLKHKNPFDILFSF
jgi:hypothetical protein